MGDVRSWAESVSLIPIESRGKRPLIPWTEFQSRLATEEEREGWYMRFPGCNWGLVTGKISGIVALDFDGEEGLALRKEKNVYGAIPTSLTGKGCHCLFRYPGYEVRNGTRLLPGLDIRGDGGFIVIPPSIHPSGKQYEWELAPWTVDELPELPEWVWPLLKRNDTIVVPPESTKAPVPDGLPPGVERGARNATAARVAGSLYKKGLVEGAVLTLMHEWNKKNSPPLADDELTGVVQSIAKAETRQHPPPQIVCGEDFLSEWIAEPKTLVHPVILDPARVVLAGFAGVGKSSLATNLAAAVSAGRDFLGWPTARKTVLYVDGENPRILVQKRSRVIFDAIGGDIRNVHFVFPEKKLDLGSVSGLSQLEGMIGSIGAGLVVLDSFLNFYSLKSENDSVEVRGALDHLTALMRATECSILILDHTMKPLRYLRGMGEAGPPTPRGSGAKVDFSDVCLVLEDKQAEGRTVKTLHFTKLRGVPARRPLVLDMDEQLVFRPVWEESIVPVDLVKRVIEQSPGMKTGEVVDLLMEKTGASQRTVYSALNRAESQKLMVRTPNGRAVLLFPYPAEDKAPESDATQEPRILSFDLPPTIAKAEREEHDSVQDAHDRTLPSDPEPEEEVPPPITVHTLELLQRINDDEMEDPE